MRPLLIAATLFLASCGFRPLHQEVAPATSTALAPLTSLRIDAGYRDDADDKRAAFLITQSLRERLGADSPTPRYTLTLTPRVSRAGLGVGANDVASRFDYNIFTAYRLLDAKSGEEVARGSVYSVATFGAPADPFGRISAEVNAAEQASRQAADEIVTELALHFADMGADAEQDSAE